MKDCNKRKVVFDNAYFIDRDTGERIYLPGKVPFEVEVEEVAVTMGSIEFPRIGEVSGQMVIDTMGGMFEEEPRERKPLSRQESFGRYLRKGKKW